MPSLGGHSHCSIDHFSRTSGLELNFWQIWLEVDLLKSEGGRPAAVLVPESVAQSVVVELLPDDARQGGANLGKRVLDKEKLHSLALVL